MRRAARSISPRFTAKLNVKTRDIDLRVAQSYINPFIRLELRSGMLGSDLAVDLKSTEPLALSVTGRAADRSAAHPGHPQNAATS